MSLTRIILTFFFLLTIQQALPQYFSTGQDPASIRWAQIKTDKYRLIFPQPFEKKAQYVANIMDIVVDHETTTLTAKVPRIPLVFHTQSASSNGVTVWAPKRIELYTCPPQQTYAEEWLEQLVIHEYRHAVQISKINRGFSKVLYYLFGEQITGGILGLYIPSWFLEGDATVTETALSNTGRGRSAMFECVLKAQLVEKGIFSYDKATLGSYKTFVPDAYSLGYYVVGEARARYGAGVWNEALDRTAKYPFMVVPFNSGIRKSTGLWKAQLYRQSLASLESDWKSEVAGTRLTEARLITRRDPKNFTLYNHPLFLDDSTILAEKQSMDDITRFLLINRYTGKEKRLLVPGLHLNGTTSLGGDWLVWSEYEYGRRWQNRSFASIRGYNFKTGKTRNLTRRTRYYAPVITSGGDRLAAIKFTSENDCSIDVLEVPSGRILQSHPVPQGKTAMYPNWSPDATRIVFTIQSEKGQAIAVLDTATGLIREVTPFTFNELNGPSWFYRHYIIFSTDYSGVENLYAFDTIQKITYQVTSARFASYDPDFSPDRSSMIYSEYTSDGEMIAEARIDSSMWMPLQETSYRSRKLSNLLAAQEKVSIQDSVIAKNIFRMNQLPDADPVRDTISGTIYPVKRYSKAGHLFRPHSWAPVSLDAGNLEFKPGVMVLSQNVMNTMFANAGWEYDLNEETGKFYAGLSYQGLYPVFNFRFDIGNRAGYANYEGSGERKRFTWQETNLKFQVTIPWNFSHGRWIRTLQPLVGTTLTGVKHNASTPSQFTSGCIQTMDYQVYASQYQRSGNKDLYPRFGQILNLNYRHSTFSENDMGTLFETDLTLYFPGIFKHHGLRIYAGYQQEREEDDIVYSYSSMILIPRGYSGITDPDQIALQGNYKFPVFYPDLSLGSVVYLKRMKMNLFYDMTLGWTGPGLTGWHDPGISVYQSTGVELTFDFHFLRFYAPIEMGVRQLYFPGNGGWGWEFLYGIALQ